MIPGIIHYCWFGRNPLPPSARKCIESWRKFFPDYEIKEWNEDNFDTSMIPYIRDAYAAGKYAFVSDFARMWILYQYGGLYFDTDVEVIRPMDDIVAAGAFMGCEIDGGTGSEIMVNPGLGLGVEAGNTIFGQIIDFYSRHDFYNAEGLINTCAIVRITTDTLVNNGMMNRSGLQRVQGITIYPSEWFNPLDDATGRLNVTECTRSIHWFSKTWMNVSPFRQWLSRMSHRFIGVKMMGIIRNILKR